jgi:dynein heavy chain
MKTITMKGSIYAKTFQTELDNFDSWLTYSNEFLELAIKVQTSWMYLEPVMTSPDILKHLSV